MIFRGLFVLVIMLLPTVVQAQFSAGYETGSYVLRNQPNIRHYGQLKFRNGRKLLVETEAGEKRRIKAYKALSCAVGPHRYSVINRLQFNINSRSVNEKAVYAQVLDSGKITLLRYHHLLNTGIDWLFLYRYPIDVYLVRAQPDSSFAAIWDTYDKSYFRQHIRPFLVARPDLLKLMDGGLITYQDLPRAIYALNKNRSFQPEAVLERKE
ncbi:hypothetical protein [Hymenobacter glaciei]|uniref:hypothetical protein n=1 Tax=Hymenobacter glaciei TaxID=877209 RepID=UPI0031EE2538